MAKIVKGETALAKEQVAQQPDKGGRRHKRTKRRGRKSSRSY